MKYYPITSVCKADMIDQGFSKKDIDKLTDDDMKHIAKKIGDSVMDSYWIALDYMLENVHNFKKK